MCENFNAVWKKRLSPKEDDQVALYHCVIQLAKRAKKMSFILHDEKDSILHDFYLYKLLPMVDNIAPDKVIKPSYIVQMMNNYLIDQERKRLKAIETIEKNLNYAENDSISINDSLDITATMINHVKCFLESLDKGMIKVIIYHFHQDKKCLNNVKSCRYMALKLGLNRHKKHHVNDYHQTTIIGRWLIKTYGESILPLEEVFLKDIFRIFEIITLTYIKAGYCQNNEK